MADKVRFGILGLGMGRGKAEICTKTEGAELVAICDIWEERALETKEKLGVEWIRDFDEMLERKDIDVIGIWSPSGMHSSMAVKALEAGKHTCVTKPMDLHTDICDKAIKLANQKNLVLAVDFDSRYRPINHKIRNAVRSGTIGDLILAEARIKWYRAQQYYDSGMPEAWRSKLVTEGGSLANQAVHFVDLLQWWVGPMNKVVGKRGTFNHTMETEDATASLFELESGAFGSILTTTCSYPGLGSAIEITGTKGTISWKDQKIDLFQAAMPKKVDDKNKASYDADFKVELEPKDFDVEDFEAPEDLPANIIEDMVRAVRDGKPVQCDGNEGRKSVEIVESVYNSSDKGKWITL